MTRLGQHHCSTPHSYIQRSLNEFVGWLIQEHFSFKVVKALKVKVFVKFKKQLTS